MSSTETSNKYSNNKNSPKNHIYLTLKTILNKPAMMPDHHLRADLLLKTETRVCFPLVAKENSREIVLERSENAEIRTHNA